MSGDLQVGEVLNDAGDEEARADAEWAALPGTEPDGWSFIPEAELTPPANPYAAYRERGELWAKDGMTHARYTAVGLPGSHPNMERGVWMAVWRKRPAKEAEFNPPVTAALTTGGERG